MARLLGIDLGTSYFKAGVYGADGALMGLARKATPITTPAPERREMEAEAFWSTLREVVAKAIKAAGAEPGGITALSYSSQANSFVLLDADMHPLTPVVIWQDTRAPDSLTPLGEYADTTEFFQRTGKQGLSRQSMASKLEWFREQQPEVWNHVRHVRTLSDYLASTLAGQAVGDSGTAALTSLWDIPGDCWHAKALDLIGIEPSWMPKLSRPGTLIGGLCAAGAAKLGLAAGTPLTVGSLDHHAAAVGSGLGRLAPVSLSTGTVLAALRLCGTWQPVPGVIQGPDWKAGRFYELVADGCGAGILERFRQQHAPDEAFEALLDAAAEVAPGTALPKIAEQAWTDPDPRHFGGLAPTDPGQRGVIALAMMEAIAARQRGLIERLCGNKIPDTIIATGGGARSPLWLQIKARALGARVLAPESAERACLGAALFASVGAGLAGDVDDASLRMVKPGRVYEP